LPTQQKVDRVQDIKDRLERSSITLTASYAGISVNNMILLRRAMRAGGIDFTIVKNTLLNLAAIEANKSQISEIIQGPTAVAIGYDDPAAAAKILSDFIRDGGTSLAIIGAVMGDGAPMSPDEVTKLASLPSKDILLAMLLGQMQSPLARLLTVMNGPIQALDNVLQARVRQLEEQSPEPETRPEASTEEVTTGEAATEEPEATADPEAISEDTPAEEEPADEAENAPDEEVAAEETSEEPKAETSDEEAAE
jgi:large subunit ribosomal protein L10